MPNEMRLLLSFAVLGPALAFIFTVPTLTVLKNPPERRVGHIIAAGFITSLIATLVATILLIQSKEPLLVVDLGSWFSISHYHFNFKLVFDRLSIPYALMNAVFCGVIGAFSFRYLHRERGFFRFFNQLALFGAGMQLIVLGGGIDVLFMGWELVGLTSVLLIAFFADRQKPVRHGMRAFVTYRIADMGLLAAAVWLHHSVGHGEMLMTGPSPFAAFVPPQEAHHLWQAGLFLLLGAMGKSALVPFSGWLPRAMEGPTSSSAIFYGALSVHAGAYLLMRSSAIINNSPLVAACVVFIGLLTALHATFTGRVQSDIKTVLAYASIAQVGLIVVEIGLGFYWLPLIHILGHASVRTLQLLRSPSMLHDHRQMERAVGAQLPHTGKHLEKLIPVFLQKYFYLSSLERGFFDALFIERFINPVMRRLRRLDQAEANFIQGESSLFSGENSVTELEEGGAS